MLPACQVAIVFDNFGPYHIARLKAAGKRLDICGIEVAEYSYEYGWKRQSGDLGFEHRTLFAGRDSAGLTRSQIRTRIASVLADVQPNVVAIPGWSSCVSLAALDWCAVTRTPTIMMSDSTRIDAPRHFVVEFVKSFIVRSCAAAFVSGQRSADYICSLGMPPSRVFSGYDVVDNDFFSLGALQARTREDDLRRRYDLPDRYFFCICRLIERKNVMRLLQAYCNYVSSHGSEAINLVLAGDGPQRDEISKFIETSGLQSKVKIVGNVQYADLPVYYGLALGFVLASLVDQWGLVVNEAAASGLPLLVSQRCGCAPDLVVEGENGFTFDPLSVVAVADGLHRLGHEIDQESFGEKSRRIADHWSLTRFADGLREAAAIAQATGAIPRRLLTSACFWMIGS